MFSFNQKKVLDVSKPCNFDGSWCYRTMFLLCFGSWCYWTFFLFVVLDVIEPCFVFGSDIIEPIIVGSGVIEPMMVPPKPTNNQCTDKVNTWVIIWYRLWEPPIAQNLQWVELWNANMPSILLTMACLMLYCPLYSCVTGGNMGVLQEWLDHWVAMLVSHLVSTYCLVSGGLSVSSAAATTSDARVWCACVCWWGCCGGGSKCCSGASCLSSCWSSLCLTTWNFLPRGLPLELLT